jgi:hypothetical protein
MDLYMTKTLLFLSVFSSGLIFAQEDLLKDIDTVKTTTETSQPAFKALQIATGQSTKLAAKKEWYIVVAHRFGDVSAGFKDFFGLDHASTKLGVIYGLSDAVSVSLSRETNMKTFEGGVKYRLLRQNENFPVDIVGYNVMGANSELSKDAYPYLTFSDRLS